MLGVMLTLVLSQPAALTACTRAADALREVSTESRRRAALEACALLLPPGCRPSWSGLLQRPEPERRGRLAAACRSGCDGGACEPATAFAASELRALYRALLESQLGAAAVEPAMAALETIDAQSLGFPFSRACTADAKPPSPAAPSLALDPIRRVIRAALPALSACWVGHDGGGVAGPLGFTIGSSGRVCSVKGEVQPWMTGQRCLHRALEQLVFPAPPGGGVVIVSYPLNVDAVE